MFLQCFIVYGTFSESSLVISFNLLNDPIINHGNYYFYKQKRNYHKNIGVTIPLKTCFKNFKKSSLFSPFSSLIFFSFPFFPSLFLSSLCKLNCCALFAILPSWQSVQAQFYRLSISQLCFYLVNITFGFPCSPSQFSVLYTLVITVCVEVLVYV